MKRRIRWISIRQLKTHEFHSTIRHLRKIGESWHDIFLRLGELQQEATNRLLKSLSSIVAVYLLLQSLAAGNLVSLTISGITASIPVAYVAAVGAISFFISCYQLQTVLMVIGIRASESARPRLPGFSANMYGMYKGQDELSLSVPVLLNAFFKERLAVSGFLVMGSLIVYFSVFLPLLAFSGFLVTWQMNVIVSGSAPGIEIAAAAVGSFVVLQSFLYIILFNLPLPMIKNSYGIRWGLLAKLYPVGTHPRIEVWLKDEQEKLVKK